ncbi:hypothetical protein ACM25N_05565 [Roseovarius sp. C7]|uniref:hypothetical protein n=1 Tax=Roseovarius sp. C7 TaxID=3398643 RepID=UPI0039F689DE
MTRLILILICLSGMAHAGPWPRAPGTGYLSASTTYFDAETYADPLSYSTIYLEYGLSDRFTIGLDLGQNDLGAYKAIAFASTPLMAGYLGDRLQISAELGAGMVINREALRAGLHLGRGGRVWGDTSGWIAWENLAIFTTGHRPRITSDLTLGLQANDRTKLIMQLQSGVTPGEPAYVRLAPSIVWQRKPGHHLELGVSAGLENTEDYSLKLGVWREF